ncbi:MAG: T9SS type A sorting domain-containing protein [Flavobacteriaceae bacterium]|nr:T9SS type A sorting domain-containing protein [Flavobacteriaceae bacterium]
MKTKLLLVLTLTIYTNTYAQFGPQQIITPITNTDAPFSIHATDIDGDGDIDILSASANDNKIAWYKNTDGEGAFGSQQIITTDIAGSYSVYATDIDGDGDMDVLFASTFDSKIAWCENTDGQGSFGVPQIITTDAELAVSVYSSDIDGDGDMDVLSASVNDDKVAWYENIDGQGSFGSQQIIATDFDPLSVYTTDIDGDGDMDVLVALSWTDKIAWYENTDGKGAFGTQQIITTNADVASSVYATDIDGDGDMDVLSASSGDRKIAWYENTDGKGSFGSQQIITIEASGANSVYAVDIDGDNDLDVLSASANDDKIAWYENTDGKGAFGPQQIITTSAGGARSVFAADINGDGDIDVLSASINDNKIAWYENNTSTLTVNQNTLQNFSIYPIPTTRILTVTSKTTIVQIEIYNKLGQLVFSKNDNLSAVQTGNNIDISVLNKGFYFCKVKDENGNVGIKKILKE